MYVFNNLLWVGTVAQRVRLLLRTPEPHMRMSVGVLAPPLLIQLAANMSGKQQMLAQVHEFLTPGFSLTQYQLLCTFEE